MRIDLIGPSGLSLCCAEIDDAPNCDTSAGLFVRAVVVCDLGREHTVAEAPLQCCWRDRERG